MDIKSFSPPDSVPIIRKDGSIHPRWSTFFSRMSKNSNLAGDDSSDIRDGAFGGSFVSISQIFGSISRIKKHLFERKIQSISDAYQIQQSDSGVLADTTLSGFTVSLPDARKVRDITYFTVNVSGGNTLTVSGILSQTINSSPSVLIRRNKGLGLFRSDGSNWIYSYLPFGEDVYVESDSDGRAILEDTTEPTSPLSGVVLYSESGVLKLKNSSGSIVQVRTIDELTDLDTAVTGAQLNAKHLAGIVNTSTALGLTASATYSQSEAQSVADKLDELIEYFATLVGILRTAQILTSNLLTADTTSVTADSTSYTADATAA